MAKKKDKGVKSEGAREGRGLGFTDTRRVKELIELMTGNGLTEMELVEDKSRILLRKGGVGGGAPMAAGHVHVPQVMHTAPVAPIAAAAGGAVVPPAAGKEDAGLVAIKSPMVGTFYSSPNPESDAYVSVGTEVEKDKSVVCIIEAMKVFNEIHADQTGTVVKILASNGQAVEFGQPLFLVRPG